MDAEVSFRILEGRIEEFLRQKIERISGWYNVEVEELKIMPDHIRLLCSAMPKLSGSAYIGILKGKAAIKLFEKQRYLHEKPYRGNRFFGHEAIL